MKNLVRQVVINKAFVTAIGLILINSCMNQPNYESVDDYPVYIGTDLGLTYTTEESHFKIWTPAAEEVKLHLYQKAARAHRKMGHLTLLGENHRDLLKTGRAARSLIYGEA